jgi:hypothetical protein
MTFWLLVPLVADPGAQSAPLIANNRERLDIMAAVCGDRVGTTVGRSGR